MNETVAVDSSRRGSLPPLVEGKLNGYLIVKVDEIRWCHRTPGPVSVKLQWWGGSVATFLPRDFNDSSLVPFEETTFVYDILTNVTLFEHYLKDCEKLNFEVLENESKKFLGSGKMENIHLIISQNIYQSYYPVISVCGTIIADVRVCFNLKLFPCAYKTVDGLQVPSLCSNKGDEAPTEYSKRKFIDQLTRHCNSPVSVCREQSEKKEKGKNDLVTNTLIQHNSDVVSNYSVTKLLEKSHNIRHTLGGMCFDTEEVSERELADCKAPGSNAVAANVVDYLLGKELNEQEKACALKTIRDTSPVTTLLELVSNMNTNATKETVCEMEKRKKKGSLVSDFHESEHSKGPHPKHFKEIKNSVKKQNAKSEGIYDTHSKQEALIKYGRYLRITVQTLSLNYIGMQRVVTSSNNALCGPYKQLRQLPPGVTYFVEYEIPYTLTNHDSRNLKSIRLRPWNSKIHRLCSKQHIGKCINFFQNTIHMLASNKADFADQLCSTYITFRVYCRYLNQRLPALVGEALLSLAEVVDTLTLSKSQQLSILPQRCAPRNALSLGTLKVKVDLGSSRTCFGQDVFQSALYHSLSSSSESESELEEEPKEPSLILKDRKPALSKPKQKHQSSTKCSVRGERHSKDFKRSGFKAVKENTDRKTAREKVLLLGMLQISKGRGFESTSTYLVCHAFWKDDIMTSDISWDTVTPYYGFHQLMPVILSLDLLDRCYNNFLVAEVWSHDDLLGIAKLPLNQFYIAYRDPFVVEELILSKYPIIGVDGWVNVIDPLTSHPVGQLNVVLAMGTENQIQMLEMTRGLKDSICQPPLPPALVAKMETHLLSSCPKWPKECITEDGTSRTKYRPYARSQNDEDKCEKEINENAVHIFDLDLNSQSSSNLLESVITPPLLFCEPNQEYGTKAVSYASETKRSRGLRDPNDQKFEVSEKNVEEDTCVLQKQQGDNLSIEQRFQYDDEKEKSTLYVQCNIPCSKDFPEVECLETRDSLKCCDNLEEEYGNKFSDVDSHKEADDLLDLAEELNRKSATTKLQCARLQERGLNEIEPPLNPTQSEKLSESGKSSVEQKSSSNSLQSDITALFVLGDSVRKEDVLHANISESLFQFRENDATESYESIVISTVDVSTQTDSQIYEIFHARVEVVSALHLTGLESGIPPNCYVTLLTAENNMIMTPVVARSNCPVWNWSCETLLPASLLENDTKRLILKVWHKKDSVSNTPNPIHDLVIGFAALDLSLLLLGLPWVSGWFNINDFSGHCRGQIRVSVAPLENISRFKRSTTVVSTNRKKFTMDKAEKDYKTVITDSTIGEMLNTLIKQCTKTVSDPSQKPRKKHTRCCSAQTDDVFTNYVLGENNENICRLMGDFQEKSHLSNSDLLGIVTGPTAQFCNNTSGMKDNPVHFENRESSTFTNSLNINVTGKKSPELVSDLSFLSETLKQKLSELDEITRRINERLEPSDSHVELTFPSNPWMGEESITNVTRNCSVVEGEHSPFVLNNPAEGSKSFSQTNENRNSGRTELDERTMLDKKQQDPHGEISIGKKTQPIVPVSSVSLPLHPDHISDNAGNSGRCSESCQFVPSIERLIESLQADSAHLSNKESCGEESSHTDDLIQHVMRGMDLESIFNPLLFQHILNCQNEAQNMTQRSFPPTSTQSYQTMTREMTDNSADGARTDVDANFDIPNSSVSCNINEQTSYLSEDKARLEFALDENVDALCTEILQIKETHTPALFQCDECSESLSDLSHDQSLCRVKYQETSRNVRSGAITEDPSNIDTSQVPVKSIAQEYAHNRACELVRSNPSGVSTGGGDLETVEEIVKRQRHGHLPTTSEKSEHGSIDTVRNILSKLDEASTSSSNSSKSSIVVVRRQAPDGGNPLEEKQKKSQRLQTSVVKHHCSLTDKQEDVFDDDSEQEIPTVLNETEIRRILSVFHDNRTHYNI